MKAVNKVLFFTIFLVISNCWILYAAKQEAGKKMYHVYAKEGSIQYSYDLSGRLISAQYPDGIKIIYVYDEAGNLKSTVVQEDKTEEESTGSGDLEEEKTESGETKKEDSRHEKISLQSRGYIKIERLPLQEGSLDSEQYDSFQKKRPVIKSLKTEKGKRYLKIQIRKLRQKEMSSEEGYQIKYAPKPDFKQAKTVTASKKKKAAVTNKKWKVKMGKVYYVKVRAYIRTETGKYIYSRYSKVKKIRAGY